VAFAQNRPKPVQNRPKTVGRCAKPPKPNEFLEKIIFFYFFKEFIWFWRFCAPANGFGPVLDRFWRVLGKCHTKHPEHNNHASSHPRTDAPPPTRQRRPWAAAAGGGRGAVASADHGRWPRIVPFRIAPYHRMSRKHTVETLRFPGRPSPLRPLRRNAKLLLRQYLACPRYDYRRKKYHCAISITVLIPPAPPPPLTPPPPPLRPHPPLRDHSPHPPGCLATPPWNPGPPPLEPRHASLPPHPLNVPAL